MTATPHGRVRQRVLDAVRQGNITWRDRADGVVHYRLWITERAYRPLTRAERRHLTELLRTKQVRTFIAGGYRGGRGGIETTRGEYQ